MSKAELTLSYEEVKTLNRAIQDYKRMMEYSVYNWNKSKEQFDSIEHKLRLFQETLILEEFVEGHKAIEEREDV